MRKLAMLGLVIGLAGCGYGDATSPSVSLTGTYTLMTINGSHLPYTFSSGLTLSRDELTLNNDGSFVDVSFYSDGRTSTEQGFYSNNNGAIVFTESTAGLTFQGSVSGSVLTEIVNGFTQAYQKD